MKRLIPATLVLFAAVTAFAQHDHAQQQKPDPQMEAMIKAGTPGDPHKALDGFVGTWNTKVSMWEAPGQEPMVSEGVSENRWIMGNRYLEQRFTSTFMGVPFEGLGYTGYDNVKKRYWGTWMDNMSTAVMSSTGSLKGKVFSFVGTMPDPMTGKDMKVDEKITIVDADNHVMEMWGAGPDGKKMKMMEIVYTRK